MFAGRPIRVIDTPRRRAPAFDRSLAEELPLRILLADDHPTNQKLARMILKRLGYDVDVVGNGLAVLEAVARQSYDLVLMDIEMPEMDGMEATRRILADYPPDRLPKIIAVTANAMEGDRERFIAAGMSGYVSKPIRVEDLVEALRQSFRQDVRETTMASGNEPGPAIDPAALDTLLEAIGGDAQALADLIRSFIEDSPDLMARIETAARSGDAEALRTAAHTMKSSAADFGAGELSRICRSMETQAKAGRMDDVVALSRSAAAAYAAAEAVLRAHLEQRRQA